MKARALLFAAAILLSLAAAAGAETYPTRPVRLVLPYAAGGTADVIARPLLDHLTRRLGQPFVLENRAGAGGIIGTEAVTKAPPDGHMLLLTTPGPISILPRLRQMPYDSEKELVPVAWVADLIGAVVVPNGLGVGSLKELIALAKSKPGQLSFGSSGIGSTTQLRGEMLKLQAGIDFLHVPYRGNSEAVPDLLAGNIQIMLDAITLPQVRDGKAKLLAMIDSDRHPDFPDVPTIKEAGLPEYDVPIWTMVFAPAGTPEPIIRALNESMAAFSADPEQRQRVFPYGIKLRSAPPVAVREKLIRDNTLYRDLIARANVKLD